MTDVQPATAPTGRRGRGGADARRTARTSTTVKQAGFIRRAIKPYEPFSDEQLELIEHNAETVLQETGIDFYEDEEAVQHVEGRRRRRQGFGHRSQALPRPLPQGPGALADQDGARANMCSMRATPPTT